MTTSGPNRSLLRRDEKWTTIQEISHLHFVKSDPVSIVLKDEFLPRTLLAQQARRIVRILFTSP
jgi:hypothetical protein